MARLACLLLLPLLSEVSCTFSLFLPGKSSQYPPQYIQQPEYTPHQQEQQQYVQCPSCTANQVLPEVPDQENQVQQSSDYWPEGSSPSQDYQEEGQDPGFRFQAYQSSYRHHVQQSINPYSSYPSPVYQQIPQHIPTYHQSPQPVTYHPTPQPISPQPISTYHQVAQVPEQGVLSGHGVLPPSRFSPPSTFSAPSTLPVYQLVTMGPELPVLVRLPNQQTAILPVRTVYSLPNFLERIVQRVQNYYSVYTPLEVLKVPRQNETSPEEAGTTSEVPASSSSTTAKPDEGLANRISTGNTEASPTTTEQEETTTSKEVEGGETTTESNDLQQETTTTQ